jgi:TonB family protein
MWVSKRRKTARTGYPSSMRHILLLTAILFACALPTALHAQSTEADLKARLLKKPLYLRGCWRDDRLKFDSTGQLTSKSQPFPFTLSGIDIDSVKLKGDRLQLSGHRVGVLIEKDVPERRPLDERIQIEILPTANQDYSQSLNAIFVDDLAALVPTMPPYWQAWAQEHILHIAPIMPPKPAPIGGTGAMRVGGGVKAPRPLKMSDPAFSQAAHDLKVSGTVLVYLWVDQQGKPTHLRLLRPRGLGLDELSLAAVASYQFQPATKDGKPVTVEMNVEVNFQVD